MPAAANPATPTRPPRQPTGGAAPAPSRWHRPTDADRAGRTLALALLAMAVLLVADLPAPAAPVGEAGPAIVAVRGALHLGRLLALVTCAYVCLVASLTLIARRARSAGLARLAHRLATPALRQLLRSSAGATVGISLLLPSGALAQAPPPSTTSATTDAPRPEVLDPRATTSTSDAPRLELIDPPASGHDPTGALPTLVLLDDGTSTSVTTSASVPPASAIPPPATAPTTTPHPASSVEPSPGAPTDAARADAPAPPDPEPSGAPGHTTADPPSMPTAPDRPSGDGTSDPAGRPPAAHPEVPLDPVAAVPTTWTIRPGEHLWRVAEAVVAAAGTDPADVAAVARYHQRLIAHNRADLPIPDDPDLVFPGMVVRCPPPNP